MTNPQLVDLEDRAEVQTCLQSLVDIWGIGQLLDLLAIQQLEAGRDAQAHAVASLSVELGG